MPRQGAVVLALILVGEGVGEGPAASDIQYGRLHGNFGRANSLI